VLAHRHRVTGLGFRHLRAGLSGQYGTLQYHYVQDVISQYRRILNSQYGSIVASAEQSFAWVDWEPTYYPRRRRFDFHEAILSRLQVWVFWVSLVGDMAQRARIRGAGHVLQYRCLLEDQHLGKFEHGVGISTQHAFLFAAGKSLRARVTWLFWDEISLRSMLYERAVALRGPSTRLRTQGGLARSVWARRVRKSLLRARPSLIWQTGWPMRFAFAARRRWYRWFILRQMLMVARCYYRCFYFI
jgi:hypothetical protein